MPFDRELGTTVRKEHILQLVKAWEGDESYGVPMELTAITSSTAPALSVRNRAANGVGLLVRNSSDNGDLLRVTDSGVVFSFQPGSINGAGVVTPAITMGGDSDTGFWKPGNLDNNGTISLASQGAEIERWTPTAHTSELPLTIENIAANTDALTLAPVAATGSATQVGPRLVLRSTSSISGVPHTLDFIIKPMTLNQSGSSGMLGIYTKLDSGAETLIMAINSAGQLTLGASDHPLLASYGSAKGTLISFSAASTPSMLNLGTNGQVLTADSTQANGIKWATPSSTPGAHAASHWDAGGSDLLPIDDLDAIPSLRTLGTGASQAAPGNHTHAATGSTSSGALWSMMFGGM